LLPKRDEVSGQWRELHNGELHSLYSPPDIIRQMKSRRMRCPGHVAHMGEGKKRTRFWWESLREKDPLEDQSVDGRIGLGWILGW
jgi:hypothetical protein